mmetsp:Transcript_31371/g.56379  ORF Transcript_31371/g.56379 Transcript_31371/m.56379 type:complete len:262 (-) Transcript_31371:239-1024(-)
MSLSTELLGTVAPTTSLKAAIPGKTLPSRSSKLAPPPVLTWDTLSSVSYTLHAVAVSPPPIIVIAPCEVATTTSSIIILVPASNLLISKTPMGPFQIIVLADRMAAAFSSMDSGPQSSPIIPSGMPVSNVAIPTSPFSPNSEEVTKSTGRMTSTPFSAAFLIKSGTILAPSSSYKDEPIDIPLRTFWKVKAIPPPIIILSTLSKRLSINKILSLALAPPKMASSGRAGDSNTFVKAFSSLPTRNPHALTGKPSPSIELCAR